MKYNKPFQTSEYEQRVEDVKQRMVKAGFDLLICQDPANMAWLTGFDGWSFYTPQVVLVHLEEASPLWFGRAQDAKSAQITTDIPANNIVSFSEPLVHHPAKHPYDELCELIKERGWGSARIGVELDAHYYKNSTADRDVLSFSVGHMAGRFWCSHFRTIRGHKRWRSAVLRCQTRTFHYRLVIYIFSLETYFMDIKKQIRSLAEELKTLRREFHQYPELGCEEHKTAEMVSKYLADCEIEVRRITETGIVGLIRGSEEGRTLMLRADMDALAVEEMTSLPYITMIGEDFGEYGKRVPSVFYFVGAGNKEKHTDYPHHHACFDIDKDALSTGVEMHVRTALSYLNATGEVFK